MNVTQDADEIVSEIEIAAAPERVFQAPVDPSQVPRWWDKPVSIAARCLSRPASWWAVAKLRDWPDGKPFEVSGEYLQLEPPRLIEHTWVTSWTGSAKTVVRWELTVTQKGTLVRIRHPGLAAYPEIGGSYRGWPRMLSWLQAFVERGEGVDTR